VLVGEFVGSKYRIKGVMEYNPNAAESLSYHEGGEARVQKQEKPTQQTEMIVPED
jgi:hypothetical protein